MPRCNPDYSKTIIYKIIPIDPNLTSCYIGSTTNFTKRKNAHKTSCINENVKGYDYPLYKHIRENGNWDSFTMIEIEKYPCKDANESRARERYYVELLKANLNGVMPNRSKKESDKLYNQTHKDEIRAKHQIYNKEHQEHIKEYQKKYRAMRKAKKNSVDV